jgi:hypothetical protein
VSQRSLGLALAIGAGALLASGCGSSDDGGGDRADEGVEAGATSGPTATTAGTSDTTGPAAGDGSGEGAAPADVDACAALAGVDLEALVAEPVAAPEPSTDIMGASCTVDPVSDSSAGLLLIVTDQEAADNFANQREVLGVDSEVTGLGDQAFHTGPYLFVLRGETLVFVQVVRDAATGAGVDDAELEAAMATVLGNLPA